MATLRLVPLDDVIVFPGMPVTLPNKLVGDDRVLLIPRHGGSYAKVGVVAEVTERPPKGTRGGATLMALHRGIPSAAVSEQDGALRDRKSTRLNSSH